MAGRPVHTFEVVRTEELTPHMVRVVLGGNGFDTFRPSGFTDSYVKLIVVDDVDVSGLPHPLTLDSFADLPDEKQPVIRTMTARRADPAARELAIDVPAVEEGTCRGRSDGLIVGWHSGAHGIRGLSVRDLPARAGRGDAFAADGLCGLGG